MYTDSLVLPSRPTDGRRGEHRVQHRLLGRLDDGGEQRVEPAPGHAPGWRPAAVAVQPQPGAERQEDLAAAVVGDRARPGQAQPDPTGQPCARRAVDGRVGDDEPDAGPRRPVRPAARRQQPAHRHAGHDQLLAQPEVRHQQHGDRVPVDDTATPYRCRP